jgi:hypothetical protein
MKHSVKIAGSPPEIRTIVYRTEVKAGVAWEGVVDTRMQFL